MPSPTEETASPIAVVGLGQMGGGMAATLARAGVEVLGADPGSVDTPEGVARVELDEALELADVLVLSLPGGEQVQTVVDRVLETDRPTLIIDTSTCDPADSRRRAEALRERGHSFVDAPLSGGPAGARTGQLTVFLGCADQDLDRVRQILGPMAARITHVGAVGAGHSAKLVNNLLCGIHLCAAGTLLQVAEGAGIEPERLLEAINTASGRSGVTEVNLPTWVLSGTFDSGFPVGLMARDVALAADVAGELGAGSPVVEAAREMWSDLLAEAGPGVDFNRMVRQ
ncbi:NAD(P)-dependent oxidoreductase [Ornithinimicrobium sp. Y1694]|uniref:NAD(P)-dependent oxidoreductase n=1 Tax=Ornithinimicrobium sp. Y1694 TaxID=3418590 RepID=UPI003CFA54A8